MRIVVIDFKRKISVSNYQNFLFLLKKTAKEHQHTIIEAKDFSFLKEKMPSNFLLIFSVGKNVFFNSLFKLKFFFFAKKIKAGILLTTKEKYIEWLKCPQILMFPRILHSKKITKKNKSEDLKKNFAFVSSHFQQRILEEIFFTAKEKIQVIYPTASKMFEPVSLEQREMIKEKYAQGKEYFFVFLNENEKDFIKILKSFSVFKKWQKSNMKLIALNSAKNKKENFQQKLIAYKYRNDVEILDLQKEKEIAELLASSYALLFFSDKNEMVKIAANSMQCCIPVICTETGFMKEVFGEAALYAADLPENYGKKMISLYKDEALRNKMIEAAKKESEKFSEKNNAELLWNFIQQNCSK